MEKRKSKILDQHGNPIEIKVLTNEYAAPTVGGVRSVRRDSAATGLDPAKLARILKDAAEGNNQEYLTLAEEMEERDTHYASVLGQRKRAVSLISPIITPDDDVPEEVKEAVEDLVSTPLFVDAVDDLLDGIAKGYSCVETIWQTGDIWQPSEYIHRDPRFFKFDRDTGNELLIRDEEYPEGKPIPPYAMMVHRPKLRTGILARAGLARLVSWCFMLKSFTMQDWAAFLEVFGMPLRVGKYDDNAGPDERRTLLRAVRDLGSDAAAIIPSGMEIEFIEATGGQGNAVFGAMTDYLDKQISKAVLGQTMTTDDGSSLAQAKVHSDVKLDITKADAAQLASTINRDLIAPFVAINFGSETPAPVLSFPVDDPEDIKTLSEALSMLVPAGLKVSMSDVRKRIGFGAPDENEEIMVPPTPVIKAEEKETEVQTALAKPCASCGKTHLAMEEDEDLLLDEALSDWQADMQPLVDQILDAAEAAKDFEGFVTQLQSMDPDTSAFARSLAIRSMKARGDGDIDNSNG